MNWFRIQYCEYCELYDWACAGKDDDDWCLDYKEDKEFWKNETDSKDK